MSTRFSRQTYFTAPTPSTRCATYRLHVQLGRRHHLTRAVAPYGPLFAAGNHAKISRTRDRGLIPAASYRGFLFARARCPTAATKLAGSIGFEI